MRFDDKAILFDFDGTLMDTSPGVICCMRETLRQLGMTDEDEEVIKKFIGPPAGEFFVTTYGFSQEKARRASQVFRINFEKGPFLMAKPYAGMEELLQRLKAGGHLLAVATNKHINQTIEMLRHFGFDRYFDAVSGADDHFRFSKTDIICRALDALGVGSEQAVLVGDSRYDAEGAAQAGVAFLGLTCGFGFRTRAEVERYPNIGCAASVSELAAYLCGPENKRAD